MKLSDRDRNFNKSKNFVVLIRIFKLKRLPTKWICLLKVNILSALVSKAALTPPTHLPASYPPSPSGSGWCTTLKRQRRQPTVTRPKALSVLICKAEWVTKRLSQLSGFLHRLLLVCVCSFFFFLLGILYFRAVLSTIMLVPLSLLPHARLHVIVSLRFLAPFNKLWRAAATICPALLLPRGRRSALRRRADGKVAAVSSGVGTGGSGGSMNRGPRATGDPE